MQTVIVWREMLSLCAYLIVTIICEYNILRF